MIADIPVCEWENPGSNRSTVSFEQAIKIAPLEDRKALLAKINAGAKGIDDQIEIRNNQIYSINSLYEYDNVIERMNFGHNGRICTIVTRKKWKVSDVQSAMVWRVNGRSYAYAAICGNFFLIVGREIPTVKLYGPPEVPTETPIDYLPPIPTVPPELEEGYIKKYVLPGFVYPMPDTWYIIPERKKQPPVKDNVMPFPMPPGPVRQVPEPSTLYLMLIGAVTWILSSAIAARRRRIAWMMGNAGT